MEYWLHLVTKKHGGTIPIARKFMNLKNKPGPFHCVRKKIQMLEKIQNGDEHRKKYVNAKLAKAELDEDFDNVDLFASLVSCLGKTAVKTTGIWMENMPSLNRGLTLTEPIAYNSGLNSDEYNAPEDVIAACDAQLGGLSSRTLHEAEANTVIFRFLTHIVAKTDTI